MIRALFLMLLLLAGLIAGPYLSGKQGYVRIETTNHIIEMSLTTLVIFFVISLAVVYSIEAAISRFCNLSNNTYSWFSRRKRVKAQKQTLEGLMRMDEGDYSKAEKLIGKNAKHSDEPVLNFIKAAEAAQQRGDEFSANRYLIQATEIAGTDSLILEIARTRILLQQNKLPAARSSVDSLLIMASRNKEVLKLAVDIYLKSKAYQALDNILEQVEKSGLYSAEEFEKLQRRVEDGLLDEKMNEDGVDGLLDWWDEQPRKRRHDSYVKLGLIRRLVDANDHESAYELMLELVKTLDDDNSPLTQGLFKQISRLQPEDNSKLVKMVSKWAKSANPTAQCLANRALGYLYVRNNDFAKADEVFKNLIANKDKLEPNDITMASYVFEQMGDKAAAQQLREEGLKSAMSVPNLATEETAEKPTALLAQK
ncbi:heme biosynthesis protein HemY [Aggregatibacter aphrophilus]|uniref:Putative protoheme IX biogenesis protein n=1 Tax=Aggregatibacter aphrophilus ATCC 33389 TaxID=985008 RepID=A0A448F615_AGGAP|nr:heme biosynthesis protein HemY [Aggregatibacter aphrophilus]KNE86251.1 heme biosynthesis protein HemY [Aggregatibacter aphrophilus ATCC 33389]OBY50887.1 heme biosynthesis protein HemY [Aggregatibacter aphrophilus]RDE86774.1 heme biosynthesis protein HemY [Aggregatibacter aphrophilus]RDE91118.1 heme biosynthesis protein HemY [Aggregatibacter aphrophilus]VEF40782.1 putative protoheme IX biogenesis protein [Aggregatibacter aphrophilus ATCC 33389]